MEKTTWSVDAIVETTDEGNRGDDRLHRHGRNDNRDYEYSRRVTFATALSEDLRAALNEQRAHQDTNLYDFAIEEGSRTRLATAARNLTRTGCK